MVGDWGGERDLLSTYALLYYPFELRDGQVDSAGEAAGRDFLTFPPPYSVNPAASYQLLKFWFVREISLFVYSSV